MNILYLTPQLPYPPISGGVIKSFRLLNFLNEHYCLTLGCFIKSPEDQLNLPLLQQQFKALTVVHEPLNIKRTGANFVKSCLAGLPLTIYRNKSATFSRQIAAIAQHQQLIFVDQYVMFQYVPAGFKGKVVVHQHNAEFLIWRRMAEQAAKGLHQWLISFEAKRIGRYEVAMCEQADVVLAAPNDQQALQAEGVNQGNFIDTYHLGDEDNLHQPELTFHHQPQKILFIGTLSWQANLDGLLWFLTDIWPLIKKACPAVGFSVVGKYNETQRRALLDAAALDGAAALDNAAAIELLGFVDDLEPLYCQHTVFVAPLRFGSGIKVKVVNSLYRGLPTVTTAIGAEGLAVVDGQHLLIKDQPSDFAAGVVTLLNDPDRCQQLGRQSRQLMAAHYTWDVVFAHVKQALELNHHG